MTVLLRLAILLLIAPALAGCYVVHTALGQWDVMSKREPIQTVIADPATSETLRNQLQTVSAIRAFAVEQLGLPDNGSYRTYADVEREFVVWNVFAAPEFSVEPKRWCFPIAGCVAYRGYFSEKKAQRFATSLMRQGFDVSVEGVPAYSTLGHFADPVLNTMLDWSDVQLAAIVFHELTHQLLYVPGDSKFNEALATVVEEEGVRRWLSSLDRDSALQDFVERKRRYSEFSSLLRVTRERLRTLYGGKLPRDQMRAQKHDIFQQLKDQYRDLRATWSSGVHFDTWFSREINNAHLASIATYYDCVPGLEAVFKEEAAGDLELFFARTRLLASLAAPERHRRLCNAEGSMSNTSASHRAQGLASRKCSKRNN